MKNKLAGALANLLLMIVVTCALLLALEGLSRLVSPAVSGEMNFFNLSTSPYYRSDETLGWRPRENVKGEHRIEGSFTTTFRTNSRGLRDREYSIEKPNGVNRIVVIGDSFTWGWGVGDQEIYTEILEASLQGVEVINLGVTAFDTPQELKYLKMEGMNYEPDMIILGFCLNDIFANDTGPIQEDGGSTDVDQPVFLMLKRFISKHSALYRFIIERINTNKDLVNLLVKVKLKSNLAGYEELDVNLRPALKVYPEKLEQSLDKTEARLLDIKRFLDKRGVPFIIALIPSLQSVDEKAFRHSIANTKFNPEDFEIEKPYKSLEEFGHAHGIEVINPLSSFKRKNHEGARLFLNRDMHFNASGHELFAHEILAYLGQRANAVSPQFIH